MSSTLIDTGFPAAAVPSDEPASWKIETANGLRLHLPPSLRSLSTYVVLEQERWFEPEMSFLPHVITPGMHCLDIGANHGIFTLELARHSRDGRVWAFEPTASPRARLCRSVLDAGLENRVTVVDAGLSDARGEASFTIHDNSELNSRGGVGGRRETVRLESLDDFLRDHAPNAEIGFVKLDAEGDEFKVLAGAQRFFAEQSPIVLFELKHSQHVNTGLIKVWQELGYEIFRWSAELEVLIPFRLADAETAFALNLVAVRPAQQPDLAARGLLLALAAESADQTRIDPAAFNQALAAWSERPAMRGMNAAIGESLEYAAALCRVAAAHYAGGLTPTQRVFALQSARKDIMLAVSGAAASQPQAWVLLVHCLHALGEQQAAVQLGARVLRQWSSGDVDIDTLVVPPLRSDLERSRTTSMGSWLRQVLSEFVATQSAYSSYFGPPVPKRWAELVEHPDHSTEIERRCILAHVLTDQVAPVDRLHRLAGEGSYPNEGIWRALILSMKDATLQSTSVGELTVPLDTDALLAELPVAAVSIVDVGASSLAHETEPYATLVRLGRARVTGFEPNPEALSKLRLTFPDSTTHRYLPHFVGDGQVATFHETEWSLTASLLRPNRALLDRYHQLGNLVREKARHSVQTVRLDDVIEPGGMDLLKIDVQGAECLVFDGGASRLKDVLVVWTEVEMVPLYEDQPVFANVDTKLRQHGLQFLCFTGLATRSLASWPPSGLPHPRRQQQLWADAIYVQNPERLASLSAELAARMALIAHYVVEAFDLCHSALMRLDVVSGSDFAPRYLARMKGESMRRLDSSQ